MTDLTPLLGRPNGDAAGLRDLWLGARLRPAKGFWDETAAAALTYSTRCLRCWILVV
jgi:hypothetical protein